MFNIFGKNLFWAVFGKNLLQLCSVQVACNDEFRKFPDCAGCKRPGTTTHRIFAKKGFPGPGPASDTQIEYQLAACCEAKGPDSTRCSGPSGAGNAQPLRQVACHVSVQPGAQFRVRSRQLYQRRLVQAQQFGGAVGHRVGGAATAVSTAASPNSVPGDRLA